MQRVIRWLSSPSQPLVRIVSPQDIDHSRNDFRRRSCTNRDALVPPGRVGCDAELHLPDHDVPVAGSMSCSNFCGKKEPALREDACGSSHAEYYDNLQLYEYEVLFDSEPDSELFCWQVVFFRRHWAVWAQAMGCRLHWPAPRTPGAPL